MTTANNEAPAPEKRNVLEEQVQRDQVNAGESPPALPKRPKPVATPPAEEPQA